MKNLNGITVRLFGGLGNQLFQYFAGLDLSLKSELPLLIDSRWIESFYAQNRSDIRDFKFMNYVKDKTILNSGALNFFLERAKTQISNKSKMAEKVLAINCPSSTGFAEVNGYQAGVELRGYYQSYKYFENISRNFYAYNWSLKNESDLFRELKSFLSETPFIALHVRGSDYLIKTHIYHKLKSKYYLDSLKEMKYLLNNIAVYVFTDDIDYTKKVLEDIPKLEFIDQTNLRASEAMMLMSLAKGIIIANSTFSYWAAMINSGSHIIAPGLWYVDKLVDIDLYPKEWSIV